MSIGDVLAAVVLAGRLASSVLEILELMTTPPVPRSEDDE